MMQGKVADGRAIIPVTFLLTEQPNFSIGFVIDTGFNEHLTLPQQAIGAMNLPLYSTMQARLADGSSVLWPIHLATIMWGSEERIWLTDNNFKTLTPNPSPRAGEGS
jgi:clan AA aspartic protease